MTIPPEQYELEEKSETKSPAGFKESIHNSLKTQRRSVQYWKPSGAEESIYNKFQDPQFDEYSIPRANRKRGNGL